MAENVDPRWPKLLSLSVHEFRTPLTVVSGYVRMLLKDTAGPLNDQQRKMLEEAEKSCARLSGLLAEISDLSNLEAGTAPFNRQATNLRAVLKAAVSQLPPQADEEAAVTLETGDGPAMIQADPHRLALALTSVVTALRRELIPADHLFVREERIESATPEHRILIGNHETLDALRDMRKDDLSVFDEWRGGCGLKLAIARRVVNAHGGGIWSPSDGRSGAVIVLPVLA